MSSAGLGQAQAGSGELRRARMGWEGFGRAQIFQVGRKSKGSPMRAGAEAPLARGPPLSILELCLPPIF